jgi:LysM repeat protein
MEVTDVKAVGSKVVFKGAALLSILYLSGGEPVRVEDEISISQIMDMDGLEEGATVDLDLRVTGIELDTDFMSGDGRGISIALHVDAHAVAHSERKIEAIVDLYSTAAYLRPVMEPLSLTELGERGTRRQTIREVIETEPDVRNVIDTRICLGPVTQLESGELGCEAFASLFYQTDDGRYRSADQKIAVPAGVEADSVSARLAGDITSAPSSGGIELRFSVDFSTVTTKTSRLTVVGAVEEEEARERAVKPSVVLRRCQPGEGLWEIAKQYSTTINELCLANGLDDCESPQDGRLLLIPKKR